MATQVPKTGSFDWLLRAATKLEKAIYRKSNYKYREKIKALKEEIDRYKRQCEIMIPSLQVEVSRLKEELVMKNKRCVDLEMSQRICKSNSDSDDEWLFKHDLNLTEEEENSDHDEDNSIEEIKTDIVEKVESVGKNKESTDKTVTESIVGRSNIDSAEVTEFNVGKSNIDSTEVTESNVGKIDKINITEITKIKTPNDLLLIVLSPPNSSIPESQVQPPGSPKKRTRSSSPPTHNFAPDGSPLPPVMIKTRLGLGQGVKRKRRKK